MDNYGLNPHAVTLINEYREKIPIFELLRSTIMRLLSEQIKRSDIELNSIESRIKTEESLAGKLARKGNKYNSINDITDIVGIRIITYYNEDVDRIASVIDKLFDIDWANSVDKRKMHQFDSFGYNSLHYICRLPKQMFYDADHTELNEIRFELQMRTALQHVWSAIQHDIGYKTEIETPVEYHRSLSRLAGLLELADNEFSRIRNSISDYRRRVQQLMQNGKLEEVLLDGDTFRSYLMQHPFDKLNQQIAFITHAELVPTPALPYLGVLRQLGMKTLADVEQMIKDNYDDAYQLALFQLGSTDIDIIADTVGIQNICIVQIVKSGGGIAGLCNMFDIINGSSPNNASMANLIMEQVSRLSFMTPKG